ncbi:hypothetical protein LER27_13980 [Pseudomonas aeruginosa]|uniref:hypothetical protein n=1 Tax=Pseudomonas aeruginosa TaxID=287 RepID=UPI001A19DF6B|nr:hypothetical protein [Pseudomonas aeruginosa]MBI7354290.1 hypothetical protein [Pseudomonas aeruginosa]MBI8948687.1 hypothetical protein [Pseudomonas aeruginosa]MDU0538068.1 hypothetical protein [Pseudomonas aeruginosa]HEJ4043535.1 hypothetical protein [Pseudomonas aeruginosa]HEJ5767212.1 hypothetical protein [Pseudomonas aeruginosa]
MLGSPNTTLRSAAEHQMGCGILHAQQSAQSIRNVDVFFQDAGSQQADIEFANTASISSDWSGVMAFISYRLLAENHSISALLRKSQDSSVF